MSRFVLEEPPPPNQDSVVALVIAAIKALTDAQRIELVQTLDLEDRNGER